MTSVFNPTGSLNISWDASDLPGQVSDGSEISGEMTRCKNLRVNQNGKVVTRDGSSKLNTTAISADVWWIEEMSTVGDRYTFAGTQVYQNESSIATGLTSAQWSAMQYNSFNDTTKQIFAINGTDRKRITDGVVSNWGIDAPTVAPELGIGGGSGLTGQYNAKYTYVRKVGTAIVAESNASPAASVTQVLDDQSLAVDFTQPTDPQVTHVRLYRTLDGGNIYYLDMEVLVPGTYAYGYAFDWESDDAYIAGTGYNFSLPDANHGTEDCFSWELLFEDREDEDSADTPTYGGGGGTIGTGVLEEQNSLYDEDER